MMQCRLIHFVLAIAGCLAFANPSDGGVLRVRDAAPPGGNGLSWPTAYKYLQDAIANASDGDQIWVAMGTYRPDENEANPTGTGSRTATFQLAWNVEIYGGFVGYETSLEQRTPGGALCFLSGDLGGNDLDIPCTLDSPHCDALGRRCVSGFCILPLGNGENSYNVVTGSGADGTAVLDGFIITGGNANGTGIPTSIGGGMVNVWGAPTVANCEFSRNAASRGGGMSNNDCSPEVTNCQFFQNAASTGDKTGGGMFNGEYSSPTVTECEFFDNTADYGGGMANIDYSSPTVTDCRFSENAVTLAGGAMYSNNYSNVMLTACEFTGNASAVGGGVANDSNCYADVIDCIFAVNQAGVAGGAFANAAGIASIANSTFIANTAVSHGGGMYNGTADVWLHNCTFTLNAAGSDGGAIRNTGGGLTADSCILWHDTPDEVFNASCTPVFSHSDIENSGGGGTNIDANPLFKRSPNDGGDGWGDNRATPATDESLNDDYGDLRLQTASPCIEAGGGVVLGSTDIAGNGRILDGNADGTPVVDMGAYEAPVLANVVHGQTATLNPGTGSTDRSVDPLIEFTNNSGATKWIRVSQTTELPDPETFGISTFSGTTVIIDTNAPNGQFKMRISIPFDEDALEGQNPMSVNLMWLNPAGSVWDLAVAANTQNSPGHSGRVGDRYPLPYTGSPPPPPSSNDLGDYGVYWNTIAEKGYAWGVVDHKSDFLPAIPDCNGNGVADDLDVDEGTSPDENENGIPDECEQAIPAVSQWGLVVLTLLVLTAGTLVYARRTTAP